MLALVCVLNSLIGTVALAMGPVESGPLNQLGRFNRLALEASGELILTQGDREYLQIEAPPEIAHRIVSTIRGGVLYIGLQPGFSLPAGKVTYRLTMREVAGIEVHSSGDITAKELLADSLSLAVKSSGHITIDSLAARNLRVEIHSSGDVAVSGSVDRQNIRISSSGSYHAGELMSRTARIEVSSSGTATVRVAESLDAVLSSSGDVQYYGNPVITSRITSSGQLVSLGQ